MVTDVGDQDRVAQIGFVVAVFQHRFAEGDALEGERGDFTPLALPVGEFLEQAVKDGFDRLEHVLLRDEAHFEIELVEFAG